MPRIMLATALLIAIAMPADAQMMGKRGMGPTMEQCQDGYKRMYMRSMHWSRSTFMRACHRMMMKDKM